MKVHTLETTIVKPVHHDRRRLWLSNLDLLHGRIHLPTVYLFRPAGDHDDDVSSSVASKQKGYFDTKLLKEALSRTLVTFYPLAGRLARGDEEGGRVEVDCNGEGVLFREAEADASLDELGEFMPGAELLKLVPRVDYSQGISSYPLVVLQVTRFKCGGVSLGTGIHHSLADGESALSFINTWSNMARGLPPAVSPFLDRTILRARNPPSPKFHHSEYDPAPTLINNPNQPENPSKKPTTMAILRFKPEELNALKELANPGTNESKVRYSTYQILTAHIWRCVSKARGLADDQPTRLHMSVDGRSRLNPPVPSGYFGNVIFHATPIATVGELVKEPMVRTLERIRQAINRMDDEYLRSAIDYLEDPDDPASVMQVPGTCQSPNLKIISWIRLPFEYGDFGWGKPLYCRPANLFEGKGNLLPRNADGSLSLAICLEEDAMVAFQKLVHDVGSC
ncbi:unnamed protein product [Linum tenue]|uniref:Uncharacterized protein n=1 Tax=Linum tenue TaxID=586396 RepID=A0AAV0L2K8_9ROSI|nr:unnamed protein product [Linum tenue]